MSGTKGPGLKTCYQCKETKPTDQFSKRSSKELRMYRNICKVCLNARIKAKGRSAEFRAKVTEKMRVWRNDPENKKREFDLRHARNAASPDTVFRMAIHNARYRAPVELVKADLWKIWEDQSGLCALTGIKMTWARGKIQPTSISLDRIDPSQSYRLGNVRFICHAVNAFKSSGTDELMIIMARAIIAKADDAEPSWRGFGYAAPIQTLTVN